ncbi:MAG: hypothetical protein KGZ61_12210 [Sandarakinorhabdus sp.]|nr:hypothetical protein [Sandarakinorhabdus sp.]
MTADPLRAPMRAPIRNYVVALLNRADIVPDAGMIAALSMIVPMVEADVLAMLAQEKEAAADWHTVGPGFIQGCMVRVEAGDHRGKACRVVEAACRASELTQASLRSAAGKGLHHG